MPTVKKPTVKITITPKKVTTLPKKKTWLKYT